MVSSASILGHLDEARAEWRESAPKKRRVTLAEQIDPRVRRRLDGFARGKPQEEGEEGDGPAEG